MLLKVKHVCRLLRRVILFVSLFRGFPPSSYRIHDSIGTMHYKGETSLAIRDILDFHSIMTFGGCLPAGWADFGPSLGLLDQCFERICWVLTSDMIENHCDHQNVQTKDPNTYRSYSHPSWWIKRCASCPTILLGEESLLAIFLGEEVKSSWKVVTKAFFVSTGRKCYEFTVDER